MSTKGVCPQCKGTLVVRTKQHGTFPRCEACLAKNKQARYDRANRKRRENRCANAARGRYPDQACLVDVACVFCGSPFQQSSRHPGRPVCPGCRPKAAEERREKNLKRTAERYWADPEAARRRNLDRRLRAIGLSLEWYDAQPKVCGICGTIDPQGKGSWCVDHDHQCCPYGPRQGCPKCVRGLLCNPCNTGLGHFKDDPVRLQAAIAWVQKHRSI